MANVPSMRRIRAPNLPVIGARPPVGGVTIGLDVQQLLQVLRQDDLLVGPVLEADFTRLVRPDQSQSTVGRLRGPELAGVDDARPRVRPVIDGGIGREQREQVVVVVRDLPRAVYSGYFRGDRRRLASSRPSAEMPRKRPSAVPKLLPAIKTTAMW
jgi:hypothetical protein